MKRLSPAVLAVLALIGAAACQDAVTSPQLSVDVEGQLANASNPPPPPIDTGARGRFRPGTSLRAEPTPRFFQPRFSIVQSTLPQPRSTVLGLPRRLRNDIVIDAFDFFIPVKYELNKKRDNGHVDFKKIKHSKAILKECNVHWEHGVFKGHGTLKIQTEQQGLLVIDCESVNQDESFMEPCGDGFTVGERCFHLVFDVATLDGDPGSVEMITSCDPDDVEAEEGSCPDFDEEG